MAKLTLQQTLDKSLKTAKQYVDTELAKKVDTKRSINFVSDHTSNWTSSSAMSGKEYLGGWHGTVPNSGTTGYLSFGASGGSTLDLFIDGEYYAKENKKVYHEGNKPTPEDIGAAASWHGTHVGSRTITSGYDTAFRTQTKGDANSGSYLTTIRAEASGVTNAPQYGTGLAWGRGDTHGYLYLNYNSAEAYLGAGSSDKLTWTKKLAFSDHNHSSVNRTFITTPIYNPNNGVLIDFNINVKSGVMAIIKIYGNSYSSNPPIEAIYQFYDYAGGDLMQQTGAAISGPAITLKVYKVDGKLKAWFQQPNDYCTFKVEVTYGNNTSTPNITLSNAAEPTGATQTITITPNRVYSAAYKPTPADIGAAASSHNHTSLTGITSLAFGGIDSSDTMSITTSHSSATSYMDFNMSDDANSDVWRWRFTAWDSSTSSNAATFNAMTLMAASTTKAKLTVNGNITADSFTGDASSVSGLSLWTGTQAQYDAITSKSSTTLYFIK